MPNKSKLWNVADRVSWKAQESWCHAKEFDFRDYVTASWHRKKLNM